MAHVCVIGTRGVPSFVGGIETICENLYPTIVGQHQDHRVTILGRLPFEGQTTYSFKGVEVRVLKAPSIKGLETFIHTFIALIYARLKLHPKIVHLHGIGPGFFSFLSRLFGFKTVVTHHSPDYKRPKWRWYGKWILMAGELNTVIFANKVCQWLFARLHPNFGIGLANYFSRKSRKHSVNEDKFLGEDKEWLITYSKEKLAEKHYDYFVYGHRHHAIEFPLSENSTYYNLGEWISQNNYLVFDGEKCELKGFEK